MAINSGKGRNSQLAQKKNMWWMLGAAALFLATKGKTILLMLGKFAAPLTSMAITVGAYAIISPIWFAVGIVLLLLVHELGHVLAAKRKGLPVSAPLFIPFLGALIMMKRNPKDALTEAYIAFGGPLIGTIGALACYGLGAATGEEMYYVLAMVGFFLNLINLLPVHPLDGGRIATAVSRWLWVVGLIGGAIVIIWLRSPLFFIIWALFAWDLFQKYVRKGKREPIQQTVATYEANIDDLHLPEWYLSGEAHRRELPFTTFSRLSGEQVVRFYWETINFVGEMELGQQSIIKKVELVQHERTFREGKEKLSLKVQVEYYKHENDRYYEVPSHMRIRYGFAYAGLAIVLGALLVHIHSLGLDLPIR